MSKKEECPMCGSDIENNFCDICGHRIQSELHINHNGECGEDFTFENGEIRFSAYSYYIDSYGSGELSKEETRNLYEVMKSYYEAEEQS